MSEEDIEKLESVLSTEEAKKVLETALTTANTPSADPEGEDPGNFIIDEEEAKKILEVSHSVAHSERQEFAIASVSLLCLFATEV